MWLFQSNLSGKGLPPQRHCQALPRWAQALSIQMWSGCCKSMLCPDKSYHVPGNEQRNVFWPELAKLPPQLYSINYLLGKWNMLLGSCRLCPPKHRNLVSKKHASEALTCLCPWPHHHHPETTMELWSECSVKPYYFGFLKGKQGSYWNAQDLPINYFPHSEEARELCNLLECLAHSQAVPVDIFNSGSICFTSVTVALNLDS